jgi:O-antigen/teichoic acid export membrane protein
MLAGKLPLAALAVLVFGIALGSANLGQLLVPGAALLCLTSYSTLLRNTFYAAGRLEFEAIAILCEIAIQATAIIGGARLGMGVGFFVAGYAASYGFTTVYCLVGSAGCCTRSTAGSSGSGSSWRSRSHWARC